MRRIEEKASELLQQLGLDALPVDPEEVATALEIEVQRLPFEGDLSGVLIRNGQKTVIGVNHENHRVRQRFTIAHELGHYVLGHKGDLFVDQLVLNKRDGRSSIAIDTQEIEANNFAASLLMPREMVIKILKGIVEEAGIIPSKKELIQSMASQFDVSKPAMEFRMVNLGLISADF